jgi:CheY-like chemotaxis protein
MEGSAQRVDTAFSVHQQCGTTLKRILVVDDDRTVLDVVSRALSEYKPWLARDPDEALATATQIGTLDLLITDYLMPSMTGEELIGRLREHWPTLPVLILTAHAEILNAENPPWWANEVHLAKPFAIDDLRAAVTGLIGVP